MRISNVSMNQNAVNNMQQNEARIQRLVEQISLGKKNLLPSDNPVDASQVQKLKSNNSILKNYIYNNQLAENYLTEIEANLTDFQSVLQQVNSLIKQASNTVMNNQQRSLIANEIEGHLDELVSIANRTGNQGGYLFSGYRDHIKPYSYIDGQYQYQGDSGERLLQIGANVYLPITVSGYDLFEQQKTGNGVFNITAGRIANTGDGVVATSKIVDAKAYNSEETYSIEFMINSTGNLCYVVSGNQSGQIIPSQLDMVPNNAPVFIPDAPIQINGIEIVISGMPDSGDSFEIIASQPQNIFNNIQSIANSIKKPLTSDADRRGFLSELDKQVVSFDQAYQNLLSHISQVGISNKSVENQRLIHEDLQLQNKRILALLEDKDITEAAAELSQAINALEIAQKSYSKIQNVSLFDYL